MSRLIVNGQPVQYRLDPRTPLLFALREASNLTGAKYGCGTGHCGACTVHVDGQAVRSCQVAIADCEGSQVTTIEGLAEDRAHPVQQAFLAANLVQCGFCIPGMVMAAAALVDRAQSPTDAEMDSALTNICRCGIYPRLREAVRTALQARGGQVQPPAPEPSPAPLPTPPPPADVQAGDEIVTPTQ
jgi:isoquinoline 1-oxidoreductase alpha subunit